MSLAQTEAAAIASAQSQGGLATRRQLLQVGYLERTLERRIRMGLWLPMGRGVFRLAGTPDSLLIRSRAVPLQIPGAVLTGASAAAVLGSGPWEGLDLGRQPWVAGTRRRGVEARFISHPGIDARIVADMLVTSRAHAVIDLIRFLPSPDARTVAYRAAQQGILGESDLAEATRRLTTLSGVAQLRRVHDDIRTGVRSDAERRLAHLMRRHGITDWVANHPVLLPTTRWAVLDFAFLDGMVGIEVDGRAHHAGTAPFDPDRWRHNEVEALGWQLLHVTWRHMVDQPAGVVRLILSTLAARRGHVIGRQAAR